MYKHTYKDTGLQLSLANSKQCMRITLSQDSFYLHLIIDHPNVHTWATVLRSYKCSDTHLKSAHSSSRSATTPSPSRPAACTTIRPTTLPPPPPISSSSDQQFEAALLGTPHISNSQGAAATSAVRESVDDAPLVRAWAVRRRFTSVSTLSVFAAFLRPPATPTIPTQPRSWLRATRPCVAQRDGARPRQAHALVRSSWVCETHARRCLCCCCLDVGRNVVVVRQQLVVQDARV